MNAMTGPVEEAEKARSLQEGAHSAQLAQREATQLVAQLQPLAHLPIRLVQLAVAVQVNTQQEEPLE